MAGILSNLGTIGALGGLGEGMANVGATMMKDTMARRSAAEDDERRMRIEEFRIGAARAEADRQYARDRAASTADAEAAHKYRMKEIGAASQAKAVASGGSSMGGWKADDLEKEARTLAAKGMGLDSDSLTTMDDATAKKFAATTSAIVQEFRKSPDDGVAAAYNRVINGEQKPQAMAPTGEKTPEAYRAWAKSQGWPDDVIEKKLQQRMGAMTSEQQPAPALKAEPASDPMNKINDIERKSGARNLGPGMASAMKKELETAYRSMGRAEQVNFQSRYLDIIDRLNKAAKA